MTEEMRYTEKEAHKKFAVDIFNSVWNLLGKNDRTPDEDEIMLQMAYASCFHWREAGTMLNQARGEWMISHVNVILGRKEPALHHAGRCLDICRENGFGDFDMAYAYEAMARAAALNRDKTNSDKFYSLAKEAGETIKEKEDRDLFQSDFDSGPWFEMR